MFQLCEINGKAPIINFTCTKLKPLDIIYLPLETEVEVTHTGRALAGKIEWGQISKSPNKNPKQSLIMQDSQDPNENMEEINIEAIPLEAELREHRKRESREENANLSPSHKPIFKSHRW